jgi:methylated-DNA-[protein]-cysteine S-methyltransferase
MAMAAASDPPAPASAAVFLTDVGWFGLAGFGETVFALTIGHASADAVRSSLWFPGSAWEPTASPLCVAGRSRGPSGSTSDATRSVAGWHSQAEPGNAAEAEPGNAELVERDWHPALRRRLEAFATGEPCDFDDVELALPSLTPFQQRVIAETRGVGYGQTLTYGELAARAGAPRAARAVGTVMSSNRLPILIPCHRIVASGGGLGGYSAPQGIDLKRRLLNLEAAAV